MSNPRMICLTCGMQRNCLLHRRAEFPPDAAWAWIRRHCPRAKQGCQRQYRVGIEAGLTLEGQSEEENA